MSLLKIIILCLNLYFVYSYTTDFCTLNCTNGANTVCIKKPCKFSKKCGKQHGMLQMDDESRKLILDHHNKLRNTIASGQDTRGGNSESSNMHVLSYDKELEFVAQCWAHSCGEDKDGPHDKCRRTSKFKYAGQNMYNSGSTGTLDPKDVMNSSTQKWYDEIVNCDASVIDSFHPKDEQIGHFTQVVWAETTHIGCGRARYSDEKYNRIIVYCNYGTGGNMRGAKTYERGPACSNCGSEKCNSEYKSLCGKIRPLSEDKWTPPFKISSKAAPDSGSADSSSSLEFSVFNIVLCITINLILINIIIL